MPTIGDLCCMRERLCGSFTVPAAAVAGDDGNLLMLFKPSRRGRRLPLTPPARRCFPPRPDLSRPGLGSDAVLLVPELIVAVIYGLTAAGFVRRAQRHLDTFFGWLAIATVFAAAERAEALFRIACEAVGNAAHHSGAELVLLSLRRGGSRVRLRVSDSGSGFNPAAPVPRFGLISMRERASGSTSPPSCGNSVSLKGRRRRALPPAWRHLSGWADHPSTAAAPPAAVPRATRVLRNLSGHLTELYLR